MPLAYHDGKFVEKASLTIALADFGFSRGLTIFELARVYGGVPFRLQDHLERLLHGAQTFGIVCPLGMDDLNQVVRRLCAENRYPHSAIKFYLTTGECAQYSGTSFAACEGFAPHLIIAEDEFRPAHPEAPYGLELYRSGQRLKTADCVRDFPTVKSTNYTLGFHAARAAGKEWDDILFTRRDGSITEATRSNFFCVIDNVLCTAKEGMLYGVTRKVVLELASKLGIPAEERDFTSSDMARATEAFTTGSIAELVPARQVDGHVFAATTEGSIFRKLRDEFTDYINTFCRSQG